MDKRTIITIIAGYFLPNVTALIILGKFIVNQLKMDYKKIKSSNNLLISNNPFSVTPEEEDTKDFLLDRGLGKFLNILAVICALTFAGIIFNLMSRFPVDNIFKEDFSNGISNIILGITISIVCFVVGFYGTYFIIGRIIEDYRKGLINSTPQVELRINSLIFFVVSLVFALLCLPFMAEFNLEWNNTKLILASISFGILLYLLQFKRSSFRSNQSMPNNKNKSNTNLDF